MSCEQHWHDEGIWEFCCECNAHKCEAIERVRELHHELEDGCCAHCVDDHTSHWPIANCDTRKALDGEQS